MLFSKRLVPVGAGLFLRSELILGLWFLAKFSFYLSKNKQNFGRNPRNLIPSLVIG
jgi:hypothetical protein